jgi:hypothetical protein
MEERAAQALIRIFMGYHCAMDDLTRRKKEEDLIFQNIEEKALLRTQAIQEERAEEFNRKMQMVAEISRTLVFEMMYEGKKFAEIIGFLNAEIAKKCIKELMAYRASIGKPISEEEAREKVRLLMIEDSSKCPTTRSSFLSH